MTALLALLLTAAPAPAPTGPPPVIHVLRADAAFASLTLRFTIPEEADSTGTAAHQTQRVLLLANGALGSAWSRALYASAARFTYRQLGDELEFHLTAPAADFPALATQLLDGLFTPKLLQPAYEKLHGQVTREAALPEGNALLALAMLGRLPVVLAAPVDFSSGRVKGKRGRRPVNTVPEDARLLPWNTLTAFAKRVVAPANATLVLSGAVDGAWLDALPESYRGGVRAQPAKPRTLSGELRLSHGARDLEVHVFPFKATPQTLGTHLVLSSLLYAELMALLRGTGETLDAPVAVYAHGDHGLLWVEVPRVAGSKLEAARFIDSALDNVLRGQFSPERLTETKATWRAAIAGMKQHPEAAAAFFAQAGFTAHWLSDELPASLDALDAEALKKSGALPGKSRGVVHFSPSTKERP